jgi:hypothetical protein
MNQRGGIALEKMIGNNWQQNKKIILSKAAIT